MFFIVFFSFVGKKMSSTKEKKRTLVIKHKNGKIVATLPEDKKSSYSIENKIQLATGMTGTVISIVYSYLNQDHPNSVLVAEDMQHFIFFNAFFVGSNFSKANLSNIICKKSNFTRSNFRRAILNRAVFDDSIICLSNFTKAEMKGVAFQVDPISSTNFTSAVLTGSTFLDNILLEDVDFTRAIMKDVKFTNSKFTRTKFEEANLKRCCFTMTKFVNTEEPNFIKAILDDAKLTNLSAGGALFIEASMKKTEMMECYLDGSDFSGATMKGVNFKKGSIDRAKFIGSNLKRATFDGVLFSSNVYFTNAIMNNVTFNKIYNENVIFVGTILIDAQFDEYKNNGIIFTKADLNGTNFKKCDFVDPKFTKCDLSNSTCNWCKFTNCTFTKNTFNLTSFTDCTFTESDFEGLDFKDINFSGSKFISCKLEGTNFSLCNIENVTFVDSKLNKIKLGTTSIKGVSFDCKLDGVDSKTKLRIDKEIERLKKEEKEEDSSELEDSQDELPGIKIKITTKKLVIVKKKEEVKEEESEEESKQEMIDIPEDISIYEVATQYYPEAWKEHFLSKSKELKVVSDLIIKREVLGDIITPCKSNIFRSFHLTKPNKIKVVIIGQDPYPAPGVATGLAFSTHPGNTVPASLKNMFKEIKNSYPDYKIPTSGCLDHWAEQGVFLINTCLTCPVGNAGGHSKFNIWIPFIAATLKLVGKLNPDCYYLLWGKTAQECKRYITGKESNILFSSHPSPLSVYRGFDGCGHFKTVNKGLKVPIKW